MPGKAVDDREDSTMQGHGRASVEGMWQPPSERWVGGWRQRGAPSTRLSRNLAGTTRDTVFQVPQEAFVLLSKNICPYTST